MTVKSNDDCSELITTAVTVLSIRDFGNLPIVPTPLTSIIAFPSQSQNGQQTELPDYKNYFETALLLNDDVLLPFFVQLKGFLETVQVFLGEIDQWILEVSFRNNFLAETFDVKPKIWSWDDIVPSLCFTEEEFQDTQRFYGSRPFANKPGGFFETLSSNLSCLKCSHSFGMHRPSFQQHQRGYQWCTEVKYFCPTNMGEHGEFAKSQVLPLKDFRCNGTYNQTFPLETEVDIAMVKNFVAFAKQQASLLSSK